MDTVDRVGGTQCFGSITASFPCAAAAVESGGLNVTSDATPNGVAWGVTGLLAAITLLAGARRTVKW